MRTPWMISLVVGFAMAASLAPKAQAGSYTIDFSGTFGPQVGGGDSPPANGTFSGYFVLDNSTIVGSAPVSIATTP